MTRFCYLALLAALASIFSSHAQDTKEPPKYFTNSVGMEF